jgi:hypothetical protein
MDRKDVAKDSSREFANDLREFLTTMKFCEYTDRSLTSPYREDMTGMIFFGETHLEQLPVDTVIEETCSNTKVVTAGRAFVKHRFPLATPRPI